MIQNPRVSTLNIIYIKKKDAVRLPEFNAPELFSKKKNQNQKYIEGWGFYLIILTLSKTTQKKIVSLCIVLRSTQQVLKSHYKI